MIDAPPPLTFGPDHPYRVWGFSDCPVCGRPPSQQQSSFLPWGRRQGSYHLFRDKRSAIAFDHNRLCQVCQDIKAKIESIRKRLLGIVLYSYHISIAKVTPCACAVFAR